ncbi:AEC family transporter [Propionivibrio dicarboxylicus]|uniref:Permease n=1 Tax=Propionivibrio dicarboxylicus TaxID=83767 RepID=A0A1G8K2F4_9RHOO|nr:AEC family transporter [Propionivibrio dicarboxylicus]SDI37656.1 hypothetical protein SAMN05660652_03330 [Propionivibrio dicarboxylicus]
MFAIFDITGPIFIIIFVGYLLTRAGLFDRSGIQAIGRFVINLALPALVLKALAANRVAEVISGQYLFAYAFGSFVALAMGYLWGRRVAARDRLPSTFYAMGASCANSGFIGYPIIVLTFPAIAGASLAMNMMIENILLIPVVILLAERSRLGKTSWRTARTLARKIATTPLFVAIVIGVAMSSVDLKLPVVVARAVDMLAAASGSLTLFVIGGTLAGLKISRAGFAVVPIVVMKLMVHPLATVLGLFLAAALGLPAIDRELQMTAILVSALPMMSIYTTLAMQYGHEDMSALALLAATVLSFFSVSGLLWIFHSM